MENEKQQPQPQMASFLQLTEEGKNALIHVLDIARKHGTIQEASVALNFIGNIEQNAASIKKQLEEVKTEEPSKEVESDKKATG